MIKNNNNDNKFGEIRFFPMPVEKIDATHHHHFNNIKSINVGYTQARFGKYYFGRYLMILLSIALLAGSAWYCYRQQNIASVKPIKSYSIPNSKTLITQNDLWIGVNAN